VRTAADHLDGVWQEAAGLIGVVMALESRSGYQTGGELVYGVKQWDPRVCERAVDSEPVAFGGGLASGYARFEAESDGGAQN